MHLPAPIALATPTTIRVNRRDLVYFGGCDYLRLSHHPAIHRALVRGLSRFGLNVAASRKTTGHHRLYTQLEQGLAQFFRTKTATLVNSGYASALVAAQSLSGVCSLAMIDERAHACLHDATRFLGCPVVRFPHRNPVRLAEILRRHTAKARPLVITDGMFSHDGSLAPLEQYLRLLPGEGLLWVDDAHGAGLLGAHGRGTAEALGVEHHPLILTLTLSKVFGVAGGAILGGRIIRDRILQHSPAFAGSTPLLLPLVTASLKSLDLVSQSDSRRRRLERNALWVKSQLSSQLSSQLRESHFRFARNACPVIAWHPESRAHALRRQQRLLRCGVHSPWIRYPGSTPLGYFRFALSSEHTRQQLQQLVDGLTAGPGI